MSLFVSITWAHIKSRTKKFVTIWKQYVKLSTNDVRITVEKIQNLYSFLSITPHHRILNTHNKRDEKCLNNRFRSLSLSIYTFIYILICLYNSVYLVKVNCKMHIFYESNIFSCMYFNFIAIYNPSVPQPNNNNYNNNSIKCWNTE